MWPVAVGSSFCFDALTPTLACALARRYTCWRDLHRGDIAGRFDLASDLFDFRRGCADAVDFDRDGDVYPQLLLLLRDCDVPLMDLNGSPVPARVYVVITLSWNTQGVDRLSHCWGLQCGFPCCCSVRGVDF